MFAVDNLILVAGVLILLGIASSKFSARIGMPVLVLFLVVGMLAGTEGIGQIDFDNYTIAHGIGTLALALILFDGGLRTPVSSIRLVWRPALSLATVGVLVTSLITGLAATYILDLSLLEGILLGGIVGSTDAAAVFAVLRSSGLRLRERVAATLEIESGSNDPMAIFVTVGVLQVLLGEVALGPELLSLFALQMVVGTVVGLAVGRAGVALVNRIDLGAAGLYPVLVTALGLLAFGAAAALGGSGFLSVYVAGIVLGNHRIVFQRGIFYFHDAGAWLGQITMFIVLGLLSYPSRLLEVAPQGLAIAAVLILVARPIAVLLSIVPFGFDVRELTFLSWVGLKGAVPITLATFPLLLGLPAGPLLFDVVFFVVLASAVTQGLTLPLFARRLGLQLPSVPEPPVTLEISSMKDVNGEILEYTVGPLSRAVGHRMRELALPEGVVVALIARGAQFIPPQGRTRVLEGDHVFVVLRPEARPIVDRIFNPVPRPDEEIQGAPEFPLRGGTTVAEVEEFYGIRLEAPAECTLDELIRRRLPLDRRAPGSRVEYGEIVLSVREVGDRGEIEEVGLTIVVSSPMDEPADAVRPFGAG